jgi:hypothetical protein
LNLPGWLLDFSIKRAWHGSAQMATERKALAGNLLESFKGSHPWVAVETPSL